jgi:hypothetical protein
VRKALQKSFSKNRGKIAAITRQENTVVKGDSHDEKETPQREG